MIVQRRRAVRRRVEPRGLDGVVACLSPIGWLSAALAVLWIIVGLLPLTDPGALSNSEPGPLAMHILSTLADAALVALPAGLELGFPGVRRRNRWLRRGFVLLALAQLAEPALHVAQTWLAESLDPGMEQVFDPSTALGLAFALLSIALGVLTIAALWAISDGLDDAGARPKRFVLPVTAGAGVGLALLAYLPYLPYLSLSLVQSALWIAVGVRLVVGGVMGLVPRAAWWTGLIAGVLVLVLRLGVPLLVDIGSTGVIGIDWTIGPIISGIQAAMSIVLLAAALEGLGRGTRRRVILRPLMRLYVVHPVD